jgi:2-oxoglutarate ferredoxin oxidoreductase subunit gamma
LQKRSEVRIAGLGGQGVVLAGKILGRAAVHDGKRVVQTQSYGAEARGSAAKSEVIIADERIGFPMVRKCDVLVAMSQNALDKYIKDLKEDGTLLVDESMVREVPKTKARIFTVPATIMAENKLKSKICANMIMLGALIKATGIISQQAVEKAITQSVPNEVQKVNIQGFRIGLKLVKQ